MLISECLLNECLPAAAFAISNQQFAISNELDSGCLSPKNFSVDSHVPDLYIPMTEQTLNKDGMVTSVEFSCGGDFVIVARIKSPPICRLKNIPGKT